MYQNLAGLSVDRKIEKDVFVYSVVVIKIVGTELIKPYRFARIRIPREDAGGEFVIARPSLCVPRAWIGGAVLNQV